MNYNVRRETLTTKFDADAFLVYNMEGSDFPSMYYLTGFTGEGALIVSGNGPQIGRHTLNSSHIPLSRMPASA